MKVAWVGMDDTDTYTTRWHELRLELRDVHGVILTGNGYSDHRNLLEIEAEHNPDWIVLDDCNARGSVGVNAAARPSCKIAWREHNWHDPHRKYVANQLQPDLIMACYDRDNQNDPWRDHPGWRLVPMGINTDQFYPGDELEREYPVGLYGFRGTAYKLRQKAFMAIRNRKDGWTPTHAGYWTTPKPKSCYNDDLACALRKVQALWVDGSDYGPVALAKYLEGAASGCILIGERPHKWEDVIPPEADPLIECGVEEISAVVDSITPEQRQEVASRTVPYMVEHHSIPSRARKIMELLGGHHA